LEGYAWIFYPVLLSCFIVQFLRTVNVFVFMILCKMAAIQLSPRTGLASAMLMLIGDFVFALQLPADDNAALPAGHLYFRS
jgi:hypothetical protein